jgi:hypothetical protein
VTWRSPRFFAIHAAQDAGLDAISTVGTEDADYPLVNLINERVDFPFKWTDDTALHSIDIDLGATPVTGLDHVYIPKDHGLGGAKIKIEDADNPSFTSPNELLAATLIFSDTIAALYEFDAVSSERYIRVSFPDNSGAWEISELWLTQAIDPTYGIEQDWTADVDVRSVDFTDGTAVEIGEPLRRFEFTYRAVGEDNPTDLAMLEGFISYVSADRPFVVEPPWANTLTGIFKLDNGGATRAEPNVPTGLSLKQFELSMTEFVR